MTSQRVKDATDTAGERWRCVNCTSVWRSGEIEVVKDPGSDELWWVCPCCRTPENFRRLCDVEPCEKEGTCGWPSSAGYRHTCYQHWDQTPAAPPDNKPERSIADETGGGR